LINAGQLQHYFESTELYGIVVPGRIPAVNVLTEIWAWMLVCRNINAQYLPHHIVVVV
jgi:hypothetical protein